MPPPPLLHPVGLCSQGGPSTKLAPRDAIPGLAQWTWVSPVPDTRGQDETAEQAAGGPRQPSFLAFPWLQCGSWTSQDAPWEDVWLWRAGEGHRKGLLS